MSLEKQSLKYSELIFYVLLGVAIVLAPALIMLSCFSSVAFDTKFYDSEFTALNVYDDPYLEGVDILLETGNLLDYLRTGNGAPSEELFNERESSHLVDVEGVFSKALSLRRGLFFATLIILIILINFNLGRVRNAISLYFIGAPALTLGFLGGFFFALRKFDVSFVRFHEIFFDSGTWIFPRDSLMVHIFSERLFLDAGLKILQCSLLVCIILLATGLVMRFGPSLGTHFKKFIMPKR